MLTLLKLSGTKAILGELRTHQHLTITDRSDNIISPLRRIEMHVPAIYSKEQLNLLLKEKPNACIVRTVSHEPKGKQVLEPDGSPYLDEFGYPVYVMSRVSWTGEKDIDERYAGTDLFSDENYEIYDPEYNTLLRAFERTVEFVPATK